MFKFMICYWLRYVWSVDHQTLPGCLENDVGWHWWHCARSVHSSIWMAASRQCMWAVFPSIKLRWSTGSPRPLCPGTPTFHTVHYTSWQDIYSAAMVLSTIYMQMIAISIYLAFSMPTPASLDCIVLYCIVLYWVYLYSATLYKISMRFTSMRPHTEWLTASVNLTAGW